MAEKEHKPNDPHPFERILERKELPIDVHQEDSGNDKNPTLPPLLEEIVNWVRKQLDNHTPHDS